MTKCPVSHVPAAELLSREFARCPFPKLAELQRDAPVHQVENLPWYLVTRHEECAEVLRDTETFSSEHDEFGPALTAIGIAPSPETYAKMKTIGGERGNMVDTIPHRDPPDHGRQRRAVVKAITARFRDWEGFIEGQSARLLECFDGREEIDVISEIAAPLPIAVIAEILGVSDEYLPKIKQWSDHSSQTSGRYPSPEDWERQAAAVSAIRALFAAELRKRLESPSDDLVGQFAAATLQGADPETGDAPLGFDEAVDLMSVLLLAGNETTTQLFGSLFYYLATEPDLLDRVRADPAIIRNVVEEALRLAAPVFTMMRFCKRDGQIGGIPIPKGSIVTVCFNQANRDPKQFNHPDAFDPLRPHLRRHLGFGRGLHLCPGAPLARLEACIWLQRMSEKVKTITLAGPDAVRYDMASMAVRGMTSLRVRYELFDDVRSSGRFTGEVFS